VKMMTTRGLIYLLHFFNSPICISFMFDKQVDQARANLSMTNISRFCVPMPPYNEQKRIVGKVDKMMTLCDELETKLSQSQSDCDDLLSAIVNPIWSITLLLMII
jgi:type I restriction enzyme S subunit